MEDKKAKMEMMKKIMMRKPQAIEVTKMEIKGVEPDDAEEKMPMDKEDMIKKIKKAHEMQMKKGGMGPLDKKKIDPIQMVKKNSVFKKLLDAGGLPGFE